VLVVVTLTPATGTDGVHLSDTDITQACGLNASGTNVGVYFKRCPTESGGHTAGTNAEWTTVPGTYYWQIWAAQVEVNYSPPPAGGVIARDYYSPIFTITVANPPPPPMQPPEQSEPTPAPAHHQCTGRRVKIGGRSTCLHSGAPCSWRYRHQYTRYHYACVRRAGRYRLVRR
jgi:hypothetical protein